MKDTIKSVLTAPFRLLGWLLSKSSRPAHATGMVFIAMAILASEPAGALFFFLCALFFIRQATLEEQREELVDIKHQLQGIRLIALIETAKRGLTPEQTEDEEK